TRLPPWLTTEICTSFAFKYASAVALFERDSIVNTAASPIPGISDALGPLVFALRKTPCLSKSGLVPGHAFDASRTGIGRAESPHSLVLGPQEYVQETARDSVLEASPLPIWAFGSRAA